MKAKIIFVILIFLLLILCFYVSRKNQSLAITNNRKEKFQSSTETQEPTPDEPQTIPLYSISVVSTPYLTYLDTLARDGKTYIASHIRFNDNSKYIPIKITPLCKFDITQDKLLFYFLIDILDDDEYDSYDYRIIEPTITMTSNEKYKNLPLLSSGGDKIFKYKIRTNTDFTEFMRVRTDLDFMLPHSTDPLDISNDRDMNKLLDIDMKVQEIDNELKEKNYSRRRY